MKRILISILSDYLQPNFLLIKEFDGKYDELMFITTSRMEETDKKKSYWLEKALALPENSVRRINVVEDDFEKIKSAFSEENFSVEDEYLINLTGGTKVMPLAAYEYFKTGFNSEFYYVPIGKNVIKSLSADEEFALNYRLNLKEYFTLYGLRYEDDNTLLYPENHTIDLFEKFRKQKFNRYKVPEIRDAQTLSGPRDRSYYGGKWFEEYCYSRLKREHNLLDDSICKSASIYREDSKSNDNEIDVMFVKNNQLYVFECKVGMTGFNSPRDTIEQYQYKLAAIAKDFGLKVEAYILTLHKIFNNPTMFSEAAIENIRKRQAILGLRGIIDSVVFTRNEPLLESIKHDMPKATMPQRKTKVEKNRSKSHMTTEIPKLQGLKVVGKIDLDSIKKKK